METINQIKPKGLSILDMKVARKRIIKILLLAVFSLPYLLYLRYVIRIGQGPVDYETFMAIGHRLLTASQVYGENSYYPLPFVMIFAFFRWLPYPLSIAIWLLVPVILALWSTHWNPLVLLYAPLFAHFVGGQASVFGMIGLWGYRKNVDKAIGGVFLGLMLLKPQLGIFPLAFAMTRWWQQFQDEKQVSGQVWTWVSAMLFLFLPSFFVMPDWPLRWLRTPRPLFERALAGFLPRTLLYFCDPHVAWYWLILVGLGIVAFILIWYRTRQSNKLDFLLMTSFIVSPLVHDYDLIQLIPLLDDRRRRIAAVLLSIPGWFVVLFAYANDKAWYLFSLIPLGLLGVMLAQQRDGMQNKVTT